MFIMSLYVLGEHMSDAREHTKLSLILLIHLNHPFCTSPHDLIDF